MKKLLKILFIMFFFNAFTHASSNSNCEQKKCTCVNIIKKSTADITLNREAEFEIHPLNIFAFRFN